MKGARLKGALSREPQPKPQRLSPGVYRGAGGGLVNQKGRPLPSQGMQRPQERIGQTQDLQQLVGSVANESVPMSNSMPYEIPQNQMPMMPQPSANMGGQYRLSPGVYGTQEQAMQQMMQQARQPAMPMPQNGLGQTGINPVGNWNNSPMVPQNGAPNYMYRRG